MADRRFVPKVHQISPLPLGRPLERLMHHPTVCMVSVQRAASRGEGEIAAHYGRRAEAGAVSSNLLILATIMMDEDDRMEESRRAC
jgi:hypothetical protein